ncbi:MAG TPA: thymidine phosphorylase [Candidatus Eisenbacteria bacterium]
MADPRELIREKRDGRTHDPDALRGFLLAYARGDVPDYQASAWLMAAFLKGLDERETQALTRALLESGRRFDWTGLGRPSADKHSTGGVGDKISLALAPLVAACDVLVPMVSGRGLGHTGGTLDKLESIPGFRTRLTPEAMRAQLDAIGVVMVGQGPDLAPADGKLYALRDVTATVEFEPFIVSSIVSKKIAEGAGAVVYDVKCGNGAFMRTPEAARSLARRLVAATRGMGARAAALITDMSQPLGRMAGNALEVREAVDTLQGGGPADVRELTLELGARMLELAGAEPDSGAARKRAVQALDSGAAWKKFVAMVEAQGGEAASLERDGGLPRAPRVAEVHAPRAGAVAAIDTYGLGELVVALGGGRRAKEDEIDPRVGLEILRRIGDRVGPGEPLARLHLAADDPAAAQRAAACFTIADRAPQGPALVLERVE